MTLLMLVSCSKMSANSSKMAVSFILLKQCTFLNMGIYQMSSS